MRTAEGENNLARAQRHVEEGAKRIANLKARIAELHEHGHFGPAAIAKELLQTLEETQRLATEHLRIELELHPPKQA